MKIIWAENVLLQKKEKFLNPTRKPSKEKILKTARKPSKEKILNPTRKPSKGKILKTARNNNITLLKFYLFLCHYFPLYFQEI